jgi:hypothetical protein
MTSPADEPRIDKTAFTVDTLDHADDDAAYWWSRTPEERLRHALELRRLNYGDLLDRPFQRVLEIVEREWG